MEVTFQGATTFSSNIFLITEIQMLKTSIYQGKVPGAKGTEETKAQSPPALTLTQRSGTHKKTNTHLPGVSYLVG